MILKIVKNYLKKMCSANKAVGDIAERNRMQEELVKSRQKSLLHRQRTPLAVIEWNANFEVVEWNPAAEKIFGYRKEEALGHNADFIIHENAKGHVDEVWQNLLSQQGGMRSTNENITKEGNAILCEWYNTPLISDGGEVLGVASLAQDVTNVKQAEEQIKKLNKTLEQRVAERTAELAKANEELKNEIVERKKMEEQLNRSERKIRAWVENSPVCTKIVDLDFNLQFMSSAGIKRLNIEDVTSFYGKSYPFNFFPESFQNKMTKNMEKVKETGGIIAMEASVVDIEGNELWFHSTLVPVNDDENRIDYIMVVSIDITERKKAEESLRKSEQRFRQYFDLGLIGMAITSLEKEWVEFNDTLCNMFGYAREDFAKLTWEELTHPEDLKSDIAQFNRVLAGEINGYSMEKRFIHRNGSILYALISTNAVRKADGSVDYFLALVHDITESKKMEGALIQSEKLKSIGTITAGISHEFNNLLAIISGNVQLLEGDYKDDKVLTAALGTIMKAADDGTEISSNMLKFAKTRLETIELESTDIRDMIMQSLDFTKPRWKNEAQAKGIDYKINTEGMRRVPFIMCKHTEMREIFVNITNNSLDAMPGGGSITFSTWSVDETVFVSVSDTGKGMPDNVRKNIFDPFFSTKGVEGTGLGMSMVYGIVNRYGGKIEVDSEPGNGATFTMQFPTTDISASLIEIPETEPETDEKSLRILVVDDKEDILDILNKFLSRSGHKVKTSDNGADAIKMIEGEVFDLVLCDLAMPNVFGYDVVKVLNGLKKRPKIGIITGWSDGSVSGKEMEVDFYLRKPFKHAELKKHIDELYGAYSR